MSTDTIDLKKVREATLRYRERKEPALRETRTAQRRQEEIARAVKLLQAYTNPDVLALFRESEETHVLGTTGERVDDRTDHITEAKVTGEGLKICRSTEVHSNFRRDKVSEDCTPIEIEALAKWLVDKQPERLESIESQAKGKLEEIFNKAGMF